MKRLIYVDNTTAAITINVDNKYQLMASHTIHKAYTEWIDADLIEINDHLSGKAYQME